MDNSANRAGSRIPTGDNYEDDRQRWLDAVGRAKRHQ